MDPLTWTTMQESMYRTMQMLIEYLTLAVGLVIALFVIVCIVSALGDHLAEKTRLQRRRSLLAPPPPATEEVLAVLTTLDDSSHRAINRVARA